MSLKKGSGEGKSGLSRINEQIRAREVRVIGEDGTQLGIMSVARALERAQEVGMDLVEVAPNDKTPVCRILDYGKYKYEMAKKQNKANPNQSKIKEVRLRPGTGDNDVMVKVNSARSFLKSGDRVQVSIMFRGRELAHMQEGEKMMQLIITQLSDCSKIDAPPQKQGKRITCTLAPL